MKARPGHVSGMTIGAMLLGIAASSLAMAQDGAGVPASVVVTVESRHGKTVPTIEAGDISVRQGKDQRPVNGFESLANSPTELLLLIDDSARGTFDTEIATLKRFIQSLPGNFSVAVAYMRNGTADFTARFTTDHAAAANGIRVAVGAGGADVSPYDSLTDAIRKWPASEARRREVLMISSGIEGLGGGYAPDNPYVNAGIESAVKAGVVVYTIYSPSVGHSGHSLWRTTWGQNFLSQLADETGGESYYIGTGSPVTFQPYLDEFLRAQQQQYLLTFQAKAENKAGLQSIHVSVKNKDASLAAPDKIYVKAGL